MLLTRIIAVIGCLFFVVPSYACTIFVLTDSKKTLFFNNEDYSNPAIRIWFLPPTKGYYGAAYVGFSDGYEQGGVNTEGLAFDWVASQKQAYFPSAGLRKARGNPTERMLESCATVEEAIAFYQQYQDTTFSYATILIADKTGASVIIGTRNGKLYFDRSHQSRGFGYGEKVLREGLAKSSEASLQSGLPILQACKQEGQYATKYSTVYDLRSGEMYVISSHEEKPTKLNLLTELAKGSHYYDIPRLNEQLKRAPMALPTELKRFIFDGYSLIVDSDPTTTKRFRTIFENSYTGNLQAKDFTPELWQQIQPNLKEIAEEFKKQGKINSFTLVERKEVEGQSSYRYLIEYEYVTILQQFVVNEKNQLALVKGELWEWKPK